MSMKLYFVRSTLKDAKPYRNVKFAWFAGAGSRPPVFAPATELIENYDALDEDCRRCAKAAVYELMSLREAEAVRDYLVSDGHDEVTIEEVNLPIPANSYPPSEFPRDRWEGCWVRSSSDWRFPGTIHGYYDLRLAELSTPLAEHATRVLDLDDDIPF